MKGDKIERPKRRRYKDNPYYLIYDEDKNKYYILFKDGQGVVNNVEVSLAIYDAFNRFELDDLSELNEYDNHIEHLDLDEETIYSRAKDKQDDLDDEIIRKTTYEDLLNAINKLPEIQKRRIKKYYFDEIEGDRTSLSLIEEELKKIDDIPNYDNKLFELFSNKELLTDLNRDILLTFIDTIKISEDCKIEIIFKFHDIYKNLNKYVKDNKDFL